jgi:hypothetical protein
MVKRLIVHTRRQGGARQVTGAHSVNATIVIEDLDKQKIFRNNGDVYGHLRACGPAGIQKSELLIASADSVRKPCV